MWPVALWPWYELVELVASVLVDSYHWIVTALESHAAPRSVLTGISRNIHQILGKKKEKEKFLLDPFLC